MTLKIVVDSTCDMPAPWFEQYGVAVVPFNIQFGTDTYREGVDITPQEFYRRIQAEQALPTTSQPSVGDYLETYRRLSQDGSEILSLHLSGKLSGSWQSAHLAATQLSPPVGVYVIDSQTGSVGQGLMVREAAQRAQAGEPVPEIVRHLETRRSELRVFILLKDLRYARMSGRVGVIKETLASLLNVKPILGVENGNLVPLDRVRGYRKGLERMVALAEQAVGDRAVHIGMTHALARAEAEDLLARLQTRLNCRDSFIVDMSISMAVHFGPGTVGFAAYPAE